MRYKRITLDGYIPLRLSGATKLDWSPTASYQMILGTNGSGKSSLMAELSPLPPTPGDYTKPGSKRVEIEHEDVDYILHSTMSSTTRHSFIRDGIELNEGGTGAIQKELVWRYFRYTEEYHKLITGRILFTDMTQAERRKWITRLSQADYTFALNMFEIISKEAIARRGFLKIAKQRLHDETVALQQMEQAEGLEERVKALQDDLSALLYVRFPTEQTATQAMHTVQEALLRIATESQPILKVSHEINSRERTNDETFGPSTYTHWKDRNFDRMQEAIRAGEQVLAADQAILDRLITEYTEIETQLGPLTIVENQDVGDMEARLQALQNERDALRGTIIHFPLLLTADEPEALLSATQEILPRVLQVFSILPDNSDQRFSRANLEKATTLKRQAIDQINHDEGAIRVLNQQVHAIEHARQETCPECKFVWTPGIRVEELPQLKQKIASFTQEIHRCNQRLEETSKFLEEMDAYMSVYRQWRSSVSQYPRLQPLWDYVLQQRYDIVEPMSHRDVFLNWEEEARTAARLFRVKEEIDKLTKLIEVTKLGEHGHLLKRKEELSKEIEDRGLALHWDKGRLQCELVKQKLFHQLEQSTARWTQAIENLEDAYARALEALANEAVEKDIVKIQSQLGALQHALRAKEVLMGVIKEKQLEIEKAELDYEAYALLAKELSPKEGLIAEQLTGFIKCLVAQLNSIIASVWTYEVEVQPCGLGDGELDYQFPLQSGAAGPYTADVKLGSTSMKDIINFAFAQTAMLYLDLKDYPLFVDELGASFDEAHRPAINQFISRLMESQRYSQVFMISHYVAGWGSFNDAEYLVLDGRNITVPSSNNTHAVFS